MKKYTILFMFLMLSISSYTFDMEKYLIANRGATNEEFVDYFPYSAYLKEVEFTDFKTLQKHRYLIYKYRDKGDNVGDRFIYKLAESFIERYPVTLNNLESKIDIAEAFIKRKPYFNSGIDEIYKITGYYLLSQVAAIVEEAVDSGKLKKSSDRVVHLINRLNSNNVSVSIKVTKAEKVIKNIKKGNVSYIGDRILLKIKEYLAPTLSFIPFNKDLSLLAVTIILIVLFLSKKRRKFSFFLFVFVIASPKIIELIPKSKNKEIKQINSSAQYKPNVYLESNKVLNGGISVFNLYDKKRKKLGQVLWMNRKNVQARYFSAGTVFNNYVKLSKSKKILLVCAGGFTNQEGRPLGISIENGQVVNAILRHDRDAIIIIENTGGIRVLNLKRKEFILPGLKNKISNPKKSLLAYSDLINWATKNKATVFQTQLLAYSDKLLIDVMKAPKTLCERRILALFRDNATGKIDHAVFNIEMASNLAVISSEIFKVLKSRDKKVEALINLDVGSYNILEVFDSNGNLIRGIKGPTPVNTATNLLVYSYK